MSKVTRRRLAEAYQGEPDLVRQGSIRYALLGEVARCCTWSYGEGMSIGSEAERRLYGMRGNMLSHHACTLLSLTRDLL